jgi:6-phosphogluconolactonase
MAKPLIRPFPDAEAVCRAAAEEFRRLASDAQHARARFTVALSGGSTPRRLYEILTETPFREQIDWQKGEFFWGDERAVQPDHADSNHRMAKEALLHKIAAPPSAVHRLQAERPDLDAAAWDYQKEIARTFQISQDGPPPAFDLVLLGMGPDGHTASLFPYTTALKETHRWVVPNYVPKFSAYRLTMTAPILNQARHVLFLVAGADKAGPLAEVLEGRNDPERLPAQLIRPQSGELQWYVDESAAGKLEAPA